jgi:autotransporter-associated beta strand protein
LGNDGASETLQFGTIMDDPNSGGTVALGKVGSGVLTLSAANSYSGSTTISAGTLVLASGGAIPNSAQISIAANATFDVSQTFFDLGASQTLSGGGTVNGSVQAEGTIAPAGTLTFNNDLTINGNLAFSVNTSLAQSNDVVNVSGTLSSSGTGTLTVNNHGPTLVAGDKFTLFNQPLSNGNNLKIVPPTGVVLTNNLALDGSIKVLSVTPVLPPHITNISLSGTNIIISGTNGLTGAPYFVLSSTNLALPLAHWTVLSSNIFQSANFSITNPVDPSAPRDFYLLHIP